MPVVTRLCCSQVLFMLLQQHPLQTARALPCSGVALSPETNTKHDGFVTSQLTTTIIIDPWISQESHSRKTNKPRGCLL